MEVESVNQKLEEILKNKTFSHKVYYDIYKILEEEKEQYSNNSNGVFINLNNCKNDTVVKIYDYIINIEKNHKEHEEYLENTEKQIDNLKKIIVDKPKPQIKEPKRRYNKLTKASKQVLEKELVKEKQVYKGVYKRIYNSMRGYKNKPVKKEYEISEHIEEDEEMDVEKEEPLEELEDIEDDDLFGDDISESEHEEDDKDK